MGIISDNTRSRFGRRKPYLVLGGAAHCQPGAAVAAGAL